MRRKIADRGFTLLEVMIALGVLFGALVVLLRVSSANVKAVGRAKHLTVATSLVRVAMLDLEEELIKTGFSEMAETEDGDFGDQGYPKIKWEATIEKVELPGLEALMGAGGQPGDGKEGETPSTGTTPPASGSAAGGLAAQGLAGGLGGSIMATQFELVKKILENAIRKVTMKVIWHVGNDEESIVVVCYFTDPKAVDQAMSGMPPPDAIPGAGGKGRGKGKGNGRGATP